MSGDIQILIVEDNQVVATDLKKRIEKLGYGIFAIVDSGEAVLSAIKENQPDIILMDIVLKGRMSGIETVGKIKSSFDIPVIYITAFGDANTLVQAKESGPYQIISKPFKDKDLYASIEMALYKHTMEKRVKTSEKKYHLIFEIAVNLIVSINDQNVITDCNSRIKQVLDYTQDEIIGQSIAKILLPDDTRKVLKMLNNIRLGGTFKNIKYRMIKKDGSVVHVEMNSSVIKEFNGASLQIICFIENVTENKKMEEELEKYREHLEELVKERTEELKRSNDELQHFAYTISHDLQEPLRMVSVYTQLLGHRYKGKLDSDADAFIENASSGAIRMYQLIKDVLTYSRIERWGSSFQPTDCSEVFNEVLKNLKITIEDSRAAIACGDLPTVIGDRTQLIQLFQNLISNAIKYRDKKIPKIQVGAEGNDDEWLFYVKDNGIGIDPKYAKKIFMIFQRLHNRDKYAGTGVGLAVCKKIVEWHNGKIWVESEEGKGAAFYFTIPKEDKKKKPFKACESHIRNPIECEETHIKKNNNS
ncbi:ATP-binding protein [bacterium]|nr:ATP-binding protein [bacterium]